ncbi:MAG: hypothetical protein AAFQ98_20120, partial [Bacteroidota bacterium]
MKSVYKLILDTKRLGDPAYDAVIIPSDDSDKYRYYFSNPILYGVEKLPSTIDFLANFNHLPAYDILFTDSGLFIASKTVVEIISKIKDEQWFLTVPVNMIDDTFLGERYNEEGFLNNDVPVNKDYFAIRFFDLLDCFDPDNSDFRPLRSNPKLPGRIKKFVLKMPQHGFPPFFRVNVVSSEIFLGQETSTSSNTQPFISFASKASFISEQTNISEETTFTR